MYTLMQHIMSLHTYIYIDYVYKIILRHLGSTELHFNKMQKVNKISYIYIYK